MIRFVVRRTNLAPLRQLLLQSSYFWLTMPGVVKVPDLAKTVVPFLWVVLLLSPAYSQRSALVAPTNIGVLSRQAATIVHGRIVSVKVEPHPELSNLTTVVVTMNVTETLKGGAVKELTFRQFIWDIRDKYDAAGYQKGQELLLLLNATSQYGLTSPTGMDQGRFRISRDLKGNVSALNGHGNLGLFANLSLPAGTKFSTKTSSVIARHRGGPVSLDALQEVIGRLAENK